MWTVRAIALGLIAVSLAGRWPDRPHPDARELHGVWQIIAVERRGEIDSSPAGYHLTFTQDGELHFSVSPTLYQALVADAAEAEFPEMTVVPIDEKTLKQLQFS